MYLLHQGMDVIGLVADCIELNALLDDPLTKSELEQHASCGALEFQVINSAHVQGYSVSLVTPTDVNSTPYNIKLLKDADGSDIHRWHTEHEEIAIIWSVDDVMCAAEDDDDYTITREDAMIGLQNAHDHHDAEYGITNDTMRDIVRDYGDEIEDDDDEECSDDDDDD